MEQSRILQYAFERVVWYVVPINLGFNSEVYASDLFAGMFGHPVNQASDSTATPPVAKKRTRQEPGSDQSASLLLAIHGVHLTIGICMYPFWYAHIDIYIYT